MSQILAVLVITDVIQLQPRSHELTHVACLQKAPVS